MSDADTLFGPRPGVARNREEDALQRAVVRYLQWALPVDATFHSIPNEGVRHDKALQRLVSMGLRSGVPDLVVLYQGRSIYFEFKAAKGTLSESQRQFQKKLIYCGFPVVTCRRLECVEESLREFGVPLRASCKSLPRASGEGLPP